jgi:hypothetical protein
MEGTESPISTRRGVSDILGRSFRRNRFNRMALARSPPVTSLQPGHREKPRLRSGLFCFVVSRRNGPDADP